MECVGRSATSVALKYAGSGGFQVNVKQNTDLKGAVLASTADAGKNSLTTGTLTTSDIENKAEYSSSSSTIAGSFTAGKSMPDVKDGDTLVKAHTEWGNGNLLQNGVNSLAATAAGNAQKPIEGNAAGTTRSAIANGTVTITNAEAQKEKTGKTVEEVLAGLNRDTDGANQAIDKIFDAKKVKEQQEANKLQAQIVQQVMPMVYQRIGTALQGQPEAIKVAVHALVGGLVSQALGGDFGKGVAGVAAGTAAIALLNDKLGSMGLSEDDRNAVLQTVGMLVAGAVAGGGAEGGAAAATAGMADVYNRQLHKDKDPRKDEQKALAQLQNGKSLEQQQRYADAACALVLCAADLSDNDPAKADKLAQQQRGQQYTAEQDQLKATGLFTYSLNDARGDLQARSLDWATNMAKGVAQGAANLASQLGNLVKANGPQGSLVNPDDLGGPGGSNGPPGSAGAVVTPPVTMIGPNGVPYVVPGMAVPGTAGRLPSNAIASSGGTEDKAGQASDGSSSVTGGGKPSSVTSPNSAMRANANASGSYVDPLTGRVVTTDQTLAADHIVPKNWIKQQPGFEQLTSAQQSALLNDPVNTQGLPTTFNSSKGAQMPGDWQTYKGQPLNPGYIQNSAQEAEFIRNYITERIKSMGRGQ